MAPVVIVLIIALIYFLWPSYTDLTTQKGAPFVPSEPSVVWRMLQAANLKSTDILYDLGSGDGRIVIAASYQGAKAYGIEIDPLKVLYSRIMIFLFGLKSRAKIIRSDFFKVNLKNADVVTLFLLHETNAKLRDKLKSELHSGAKIVSYAFSLQNWKPEKVIENKDSNFGKIYVYGR